MQLPLRFPVFPRFSAHTALFIGPALVLLGTAIAVVAEIAALSGVSDAQRVLAFGTTAIASGLVVWGCHGLRRSGARKRFLLMVALGGGYFWLHLYYRYSDYRWLELNRLMTSLDNPLQHDFVPRIVTILALLGGSLLLGLLPRIPVRPAEQRRAWHLPLHHAVPALKKLPLPKSLPRPAFLSRRDRA